MRFAIISDIHANLEALVAVLEDIDRLELDGVLCLGDVVGYGPNPAECIDAVKSVSLFTLAGNHDFAVVGKANVEDFNPYAREAVLWTRSKLKQSDRSFLSSLPLTRSELGAFFVHGSPYQPAEWNYVLSLFEARRAFAEFEEPICFIGHSHAPLVIEMDQDESMTVLDPTLVAFEEGKRYIVNVGSVGQPRDGNPDAAYGVWDTDENQFELRRVAYDLHTTQRKILEAGLPEFLAWRLAVGQ